MKTRKVVNFAKFREANTEKFLSCPLCWNQVFLIRSDQVRICPTCDIIVESEPQDVVVEFKKGEPNK